MENHESKEHPPTAASTASAARGYDQGSAGERPSQSNPPLEQHASGTESPADPETTDWRYLYSIIHERFEAERERGRALDQKVGVLLAGAIAAIAFTYAGGPRGFWSLILLAFLWPLWHLLLAFKTRLGKDAPKIETLASSFPYYPVTTLKSAISAMVDAENFDRALNDIKAARLDWAILTLGIAFVCVLFTLILHRATHIVG